MSMSYMTSSTSPLEEKMTLEDVPNEAVLRSKLFLICTNRISLD